MAENEDNTLSVFPNTPDHIRRKFVQRGECWEWTGRVMNSGYGQVYLAGDMWTCHRLVYTREIAPIPLGMHIMHLCDNKLCANPHHLRAGSNLENRHDSVVKGRHAR